MNEPHPSVTADTFAERLRSEHGVTINAAQRRRLGWLARRRGAPFFWTGRQPLPDGCRFAVLIDPPGRVPLELAGAALADDGVLVIPCGEDPAYDALKSRLTPFGTVGADGARGPHQLWWGGRDWREFARAEQVAMPPLVAMSPDDNEPLRGDEPMAERLLGLWRTRAQPLLWMVRPPEPGPGLGVLPALDCDFAVCRAARCRFETHTIHVGRRPAAETLLLTWVYLCNRFPTVDAAYLLDQAWCLATSQSGLDTIWLPAGDADPVHRADDDVNDARPAALPERLQAARRAERTGPPELAMASGVTSGRRVLAVVRDAHAHGSGALAATLEALACAFVADPADYRQLELVLCTTRDELHAAFGTAAVDSVLVVAPARPIPIDTFRRLADDSRLCPVVASPPLQVFDIADFRSSRKDGRGPARERRRPASIGLSLEKHE
jgi:hypothetical protein